jgi:hypothetical protein
MICKKAVVSTCIDTCTRVYTEAVSNRDDSRVVGSAVYPNACGDPRLSAIRAATQGNSDHKLWR